MTKSPKVIFNSIFTLALNNPDSKYKNHSKSIKRVQKMYDYYTNEEKRAMSMYDYYTGKLTKEDTMNLIIEDGSFANEKEVEKRKKLAVKYLENSNLWQGVLSFNNDYINENNEIHKLEQLMVKEVIPMFLKKQLVNNKQEITNKVINEIYEIEDILSDYDGPSIVIFYLKLILLATNKMGYLCKIIAGELKSYSPEELCKKTDTDMEDLKRWTKRLNDVGLLELKDDMIFIEDALKYTNQTVGAFKKQLQRNSEDKQEAIAMKYIKSGKYQTDEFMSKIMGPNPVKLTEQLISDCKIPKGSVVCDLGSGQGLTSVFIAAEYGFKVYAADLWSDPCENREFFESQGLSEAEIIPVKADAADLPFEKSFFDAVICVDSYNYFGRDREYLDSRLLPLIS